MRIRRSMYVWANRDMRGERYNEETVINSETDTCRPGGTLPREQRGHECEERDVLYEVARGGSSDDRDGDGGRIR